MDGGEHGRDGSPARSPRAYRSAQIGSASGRGNQRSSAWGAAIDVNPSQNPYGGPSRMDQRVIDAFRRHGFVWGGTFLIPDPMHFEFVGNAPR